MSHKLPNIVVVGGGFAGTGTAKAIAEKLNTSTHRLTFITPRTKIILLPTLVRGSVTSENELEKQAIVPYGDLLKGKGEVKIGKVVAFTTDDGGKGGGIVTLESGEQVEYSVLVLATGNQWTGPFDFPDDSDQAVDYLKSWRAKFKEAKDVVFVGGGIVSVELAGEVKDFFPDKNVTIVHSEAQLLNSAYPDKWRRAVLNGVKEAGVKVVLGDRVDHVSPSQDGTITTLKGKRIKTDLVVPAWGGKPNTSFIRDSLGDGVLTATGHVKVKSTLQLASYPRIFACGDIIDWKEQKQAVKIPGHIAVVVENIMALLNGNTLTKVYKGQYEVIVITIGRNGGSCYFGILWGIVVGAWLARIFKSPDHKLLAMTEKVRKQYGLPEVV